MMLNLAVSLVAWTAAAQTYTGPPGTAAFPIVDLGYARHAPTYLNQTSLNNISYATYANIRFAQPPVGDLRFQAPQTPAPTAFGVQDGVVPRNSTDCLQAIPNYFPLEGLNGTSWGNEDCLFLNVIVPEGVQQGDNVPVLHWIYGGGFFFGSKDWGGTPAALFDSMTEDQRFIAVASNYRLGAIGWMSAKEEPSIKSNAGLYDSLVALEWTRDNIHRFGGDRHSVTVMGQSAGGGIIEHLIAANAEGKQVPFSQAILSSPGYRPHINRSEETTKLYHDFLNLTNCSNVQCLRGLESAPIEEANRVLYMDRQPDGGFPGPSISFGPVLDDDMATNLPEKVLISNTSNPTTGYIKRIIAGNMKNDGAAVTIGDFSNWRDQISVFARTPTQDTVAKVESSYGQFNGSTSSFLPNGSVSLTPFDEFSGDVIYVCHAQIAAKTYSKLGPQSMFWSQFSLPTSSYRYEMSIPPAVHGLDIDYYFYDSVVAALKPSMNADVARKFQHYLRRFVLGQDLEGWPEYTSTGLETPSWFNITASGFQSVTGMDETELSRDCDTIIQLLSNPDDGW